MSGNHYVYGDNVNMYGGQNNRGMVKHQYGSGSEQLPPAVVAAIGNLHPMIQELHAQAPAPSARLIAESLPALDADTAVPVQERHRALATIAGVAGTLGTVGQPVVEAVQTILGMLGG